MSETSYCEQRLATLGISESDNEIQEFHYDPLTDEVKLREPKRVFEKDDNDNIRINYYNLRSQRYSYHSENKWAQHFYRWRYKEPKKDMKYGQPPKSGQFPFFNKGIINKYINKEEIETLIFTEGEFKSFKGYLSGFDIIGLPSIHGFYNGEHTGEMHEHIIDVIIKCKVKNIIFLTDADTLTINWEQGKDLVKRPKNFYSAVKNFREALATLVNDAAIALDQVYFSHILTKYCDEDAKGLDDLLCKYPTQHADIKADLMEFKFSRKYFSTHIITDGKFDKLYRYFGLTNEKDFYDIYKAFIGAREFGYKGRRYEYDGSEVKYVRHEDADKYMRIGPDWMKIIEKPNKYGEPEEEIIPWKIGEIQRDYKKFPDFLDQVLKFDSFCNEPNFNGAYKRVHNNCYNLATPLKVMKKAGTFPNISKFIKHVFQGTGNIKHYKLKDGREWQIECSEIGDQFTVAIDYLSILMQHPKHMVPVPILVSPENRTGKSTFLKLLQQMFGSNAVIMGNDQFKMKFNAHYITKFIIGIDEGFLEVDKKQEKERLKQLATADKAFLENKGMNIKEFPYYGKLIISSNDADRVMKIEDGESRWFVVRVPQLKQEDVDPDLEVKMKEEVPAFLHFLESRQIFHPRVDRLWFKPEWFITEQFKIIVETTKNRLDRVVEGWIKDMFLLYRISAIRIPTNYLVDKLNEKIKYKMDESDLKDFFKRRDMQPEHTQRIKIPYGINLETVDGKPEILFENRVARPYVFRFEDWLNEEEIKEFKSEWRPDHVESDHDKQLATVDVAPQKKPARQMNLDEQAKNDDEEAPF